MSMSPADGFRTLQAVRDLRILASRSSEDARARIAAGSPAGRVAPEPEQAAELAALIGGRVSGAVPREDITAALRLAAALPREHFPAFLTATMILLADALEHGTETEDIEWYWQTFRGHYRAAAAVERAAIVQAIRRLGLLRGQTDGLPGIGPDLCTAQAAALRPLLERLTPKGLAPPRETEVPGMAVALLDAMSSARASEAAADLWERHGAAIAAEAPPAILAGFRHLYELRDGWAPGTEVTIPLLDPPPGVDWPH